MNGEQNGSQKSTSTNGVLYTKQLFKNSFGDVEERSSEEEIEVRVFRTQPALVRRGVRRTINLGNYESATVEVAVEMPCYLEELEEADAAAKEFVESRASYEVEKITAYAKASAGTTSKRLSREDYPF